MLNPLVITRLKVSPQKPTPSTAWAGSWHPSLFLRQQVNNNRRKNDSQVLIYTPSAEAGSRFIKDADSPIARMYHSVALLLLDGTVLVAGSNVYEWPVTDKYTPLYSEYKFPTEFRIEIYTPPYLMGARAQARPTDVVLSSLDLKVGPSSTFDVAFTVPEGVKSVTVVLYHGGFVTHGIHMGARMLTLNTAGWNMGGALQTLKVDMPPTSDLAPPGPYVVYVVADGTPAMGQIVMVS